MIGGEGGGKGEEVCRFVQLQKKRKRKKCSVSLSLSLSLSLPAIFAKILCRLLHFFVTSFFILPSLPTKPLEVELCKQGSSHPSPSFPPAPLPKSESRRQKKNGFYFKPLPLPKRKPCAIEVMQKKKQQQPTFLFSSEAAWNYGTQRNTTTPPPPPSPLLRVTLERRMTHPPPRVTPLF